jgi:hypothetical protein
VVAAHGEGRGDPLLLSRVPCKIRPREPGVGSAHLFLGWADLDHFATSFETR